MVDEHIQQTAAAKAEKPRMDLLPGAPLVAIAEVLTFGAKKHAARSWQNPPFSRDMYVAAMLRHLSAMLDGEMRDAESGLLHAAHVATNAVFVLWFDLKSTKQAAR